jgi:hypothetical protein
VVWWVLFLFVFVCVCDVWSHKPGRKMLARYLYISYQYSTTNALQFQKFDTPVYLIHPLLSFASLLHLSTSTFLLTPITSRHLTKLHSIPHHTTPSLAKTGKDPKSNTKQSSKAKDALLGEILRKVRDQLFRSTVFAKYLQQVRRT